jgi:glycerol uptake facilitator protein
MTEYFAEFIGTTLLVLLGNGVVANVVLPKTKGHGSGWIVITFGWAMAVFVAVWCVERISNAHLNPAVTLGLALNGDFLWSDLPGYWLAQILGGIAGAAIVFAFYYDHYVASEDADAKLATFATAPAIRNPRRNFLSEVIGTFVLVFALLLVASPSGRFPNGAGSTTYDIGLGSLGVLHVGLLVLAIGLSLGGTTGYAINPARDLGPRIAHHFLAIPGKRDSDWDYAWIPVAGPLAGAVLAVIIRSLMP